MLLIPDLFAYWLRGSVGAGLSNASTAQLLDVDSGQWAVDIVHRLGLDPGLFPISCGTRSLVGVELDHPIRTEEGRRANFTNEVLSRRVRSHRRTARPGELFGREFHAEHCPEAPTRGMHSDRGNLLVPDPPGADQGISAPLRDR